MKKLSGGIIALIVIAAIVIIALIFGVSAYNGARSGERIGIVGGEQHSDSASKKSRPYSKSRKHGANVYGTRNRGHSSGLGRESENGGRRHDRRTA